MTDTDENPLELVKAPPQKPYVIPAPRGNVQYIFGTSQVFRGFDDFKPKVTALTVPLKVREYYHRGHWCLEQEDWEAAVVFFSRALHLDPKLVELYALRAEAFIQLCDFSSAAQNLRRAYSFQPDNKKYLQRLTFVLYLQGQCLYEQCDFLDALNIFMQGSELQPHLPGFRYRCMACLLALKRHQDCLWLITKEVSMGTTNADIYILRARIYNFCQKPSLCYRDLRSALLLNPKHTQARVLLQMMVAQAQRARQDAGLLAVQGKLQHALRRINCAIENNPLDPDFFLFRGTIYRRLREFDGAVEDFLKALDMVTDSQDELVRQAQRQLLLAYNDFAVHCYKHGAYQEGVLLLNKALRDEQREKGLYINRGDCFFQLGNLAFAEADYMQALALSPQDEGANMRMGMLQEKMGFCEQRRRQFQKAEDHFSAAIQHNPQRAQYYLYRAKSRQLLQDIFGARQDVATVLLLNPKQPKLTTLMSNLFPGMSVDEVLRSQVASLAKLQLKRMMESSHQTSSLPGIVGLLRRRELERQKARTLQLLRKKVERPLFETSKELEAAPQILQVEPEGPEEEAKVKEELEKAKKKKKEDKLKYAPYKATSLSDSYLDQTSSGSILDIRTTSTLETSTSTSRSPQGYRSTTTTTDSTFSDSSLPKTQSSGSGDDREGLGSSHGPRRSQDQRGSSSKAQAAQAWRWSSSKNEAAQAWRWSSSKNEAARSQSRSSGKRNSSKAKATQGPRQRPGKTKATRSPRQRLGRSKAARGQSCRPGKADASLDQKGEPPQISSKVKALYDPNWSHGHAKATQEESGKPGKTEAAQSGNQSTSSSSSKTYTSWDRSSSLTKSKPSQGPSQSASKTKAAQDPQHSAAL